MQLSKWLWLLLLPMFAIGQIDSAFVYVGKLDDVAKLKHVTRRPNGPLYQWTIINPKDSDISYIFETENEGSTDVEQPSCWFKKHKSLAVPIDQFAKLSHEEKDIFTKRKEIFLIIRDKGKYIMRPAKFTQLALMTDNFDK